MMAAGAVTIAGGALVGCGLTQNHRRGEIGIRDGASTMIAVCVTVAVRLVRASPDPVEAEHAVVVGIGNVDSVRYGGSVDSDSPRQLRFEG